MHDWTLVKTHDSDVASCPQVIGSLGNLVFSQNEFGKLGKFA